MLWEVGERNIQPEQQRKIIEGIEENETSTIFVAETDNVLVGYLWLLAVMQEEETFFLYCYWNSRGL
ncbi:hypothetical protein [Sporosarcina sp. FA15]|uniref:hypothetical protein n=1 Tax=Sporosarcina sp. FA15 TaxID=3413031 RepID=UPI003F65E710